MSHINYDRNGRIDTFTINVVAFANPQTLRLVRHRRQLILDCERATLSTVVILLCKGELDLSTRLVSWFHLTITILRRKEETVQGTRVMPVNVVSLLSN